MAIIKCPECGQEISDKATKCIHCNKVLNEPAIPKRYCNECKKEIPNDVTECPFCGYPLESDGNENKENNKPKDYKKILIPIVIVAIIAVISFITIIITGSSLNKDEQLAYQCAVDMKNMLKDPDSFKLYDLMFILRHLDEKGTVDNTYTCFKYGGADEYGAITTEEAIYIDGEFIMNYADKPQEEDPNYVIQSETKASLFRFTINRDGEEWERVDIDVEKIKDKMGLK